MDGDAPPKKRKQSRACDNCRVLKIRCIIEDDVRPCQRCERSDTPCVFTPRPPRKKQRVRTDARVSVLEKELSSLRGSLAGQSTPALLAEELEPANNEEEQFGVIDSGLAGEGNAATSAPDPVMRPRLPQPVRPFNVDSISQEAACRLLNIYVNECCPLYPVVQLPHFIDVNEMKRSKPLLFKATTSVAAMRLNPTMAEAIQQGMMKTYAGTFASDAPKSTDLVQAMLITVAWYLPPHDFGQKRKFYELAHLAISTDLDISPEDDDESKGGHTSDDISEEGLAQVRASIGCFLLSQGMAMTTRRPSLLRYDERLSRLVHRLETAANASNLDQTLAAYAKLLHIAGDISNDLGFHHASRHVDVSDEAVYAQIATLRGRLHKWKEDASTALLNNSPLAVLYHYTELFLHEPVLYIEHRPSDFAAPFRLDRVGLTRSMRPLNWRRWLSVMSHLIGAAHSLLHTFLTLDIETYRLLPVANFFRLIYAAFILTKLKMSTLDPSSRAGTMLDARAIKTEYFRAGVLDKLEQAAGDEPFPIPRTFLGHLGEMGTNWQRHAAQLQSSVTQNFQGVQPQFSSETFAGSDETSPRGSDSGSVHAPQYAQEQSPMDSQQFHTNHLQQWYTPQLPDYALTNTPVDIDPGYDPNLWMPQPEGSHGAW